VVLAARSHIPLDEARPFRRVSLHSSPRFTPRNLVARRQPLAHPLVSHENRIEYVDRPALLEFLAQLCPVGQRLRRAFVERYGCAQPAPGLAAYRGTR
jgi:hypothetical protein